MLRSHYHDSQYNGNSQDDQDNHSNGIKSHQTLRSNILIIEKITNVKNFLLSTQLIFLIVIILYHHIRSHCILDWDQ